MSNESLIAEPDLVSVVMPCYNGEEFLAEAIDSVLGQSYPRVELIIIDDGSSDGSWDVIRSYGDRVIGVRQENRGLPGARNAGIRRARGSYLFFLDADDLVAPDTVRALVDAVHQRPGSLGACRWSRYERVDGAWRVVPAEIPFPPADGDHLRLWLEGVWLPVHSVLWPRELVERLGGYDESLTANEDGDLIFRALVSGARLVMARGGEALYRGHGTAKVSMSRDSFSASRNRSRLRVLEKLTRALVESGQWERYREAVGIAYHRLAQRSFQSDPELAREFLRRGELYAGRRAVSRTLPGRLLTRVLGVERKERLVQALGRLGLMTSERRKVAAHRALVSNEAPATMEGGVQP